MKHLKNIIYAIYCGCKINFIIFYIKSLFFKKSIFKKNFKQIQIFNDKISYLKGQNKVMGLDKQNIKFNIPFIYEIIIGNNFLNNKKKLLMLGCYEGHSTIFFNSLNNKFEITCVDEWDRSYLKKYNSDAEEYFNFNTKLFKSQITKIKSKTNNFFSENINTFDLIYLDASHKSNDVFNDCQNSFKFLNSNGILIINSVFWRGYKVLKENNLYGIASFLNEKSNFKILTLNNNVLILKKLAN